MKKQSFVAGAAILMIANAISKILGAFFKIPLTYILQEEGMAIYNTAFSVYVMFLAFVVSGIPTAVSKTVAQSSPQKAMGMTDVAEKVLIILGLAGSIVLYFGAEFFAYAMKEPLSVTAIRYIAPSVFFVALGTGCKSFFHGSSSMISPAISQVVEAVAKLVIGYGLAVMFIGYGKSAAAAGAIAGVTIGEIIATAILVGTYLAVRRRVKTEKSREYLKELIAIALPLLMIEAAINAVSVTDTSVLRTRMLDAGLSDEEARILYGAFTGYAMTIFNLPIGILATIGISLMPVTAAAVADGDMKRARRPMQSGIELSLFISVPSAVMMWIIPEELLYLLFKNTFSAMMLKYMAPCVVMLSLIQMLAALLQACGKILTPAVVTCGGLVLKLVLMWVLCAIPEINIYGAIISSNIIHMVVLIIDWAILRKVTGLKVGILKALIAPSIAATAMAAVVKQALEYSSQNMLSIIAVCGVGGAVYVILMCIMKNLGKMRINNIDKAIKK